MNDPRLFTSSISTFLKGEFGRLTLYCIFGSGAQMVFKTWPLLASRVQSVPPSVCVTSLSDSPSSSSALAATIRYQPAQSATRAHIFFFVFLCEIVFWLGSSMFYHSSGKF